MTNSYNGSGVWVNNQICTDFNHAVLTGAVNPMLMAQFAQQHGGMSPAFNNAAMPAQNIIIPQYETVVNGRPMVTNPYNTLFIEGRQIMVNGVVEENMANSIAAQILCLSQEAPEKPITLVINSPGGSVTAGMQIYDTMNFVPNDIITVCSGQAMSMGAFLLGAGTKGMRFALPSSSIMMHQPSAGTQGTVDVMQNSIKEFQRLKDYLNGEMAKHTGKTKDEVEKALSFDNFNSAQDAKAFGTVDEVITTQVELKDYLDKIAAAKTPTAPAAAPKPNNP
jgi:ATP-dependent Clp protease protease subunit